MNKPHICLLVERPNWPGAWSMWVTIDDKIYFLSTDSWKKVAWYIDFWRKHPDRQYYLGAAADYG